MPLRFTRHDILWLLRIDFVINFAYLLILSDRIELYLLISKKKARDRETLSRKKPKYRSPCPPFLVRPVSGSWRE